MNPTSAKSGSGATLQALRKLMNREPPKKRAGEVCEMCAAEIPDEHSHVVNTESRSLLCTCRYCYLLFTHEGAAQGKFRAVPDRYLFDPELSLSEGQWDRFQIPVRIAFFFHNSSLGKVVAFYPSPAGATESMLSLDAWEDLAGAVPMAATLAPDVEALIVYAPRGGAFQCYLVPIDACYELTGRVKKSWKGFDGGEEAWSSIDAFFTSVKERSRPPEARA